MRPSQDEYGNAREAFDLGKVKTRTDFPGERGGGGGAFESQPSFYCAQKVSVLNIAMYGQQSPASVMCMGKQSGERVQWESPAPVATLRSRR
jgi:hypothetical protein